MGAIMLFPQQKQHERLPFFALAGVLIYLYIKPSKGFLLFKPAVTRKEKEFCEFSGKVTIVCSSSFSKSSDCLVCLPNSPLKISVISQVIDYYSNLIYSTLKLVH